MTDTLCVSAGRHNLHAAIDLAREYGLGIELMHFAAPDILDGNLLGIASEVKRALSKIEGPLSLHGPFYDMSPGSVDEKVNEIARLRFTQALHTASELGARRMVVHANFLAPIRNDFYRRGWHARNVDFWRNFAEVARAYDVVIAVENMWEFDPAIIGNLLREIDHPYLKACLDIGHSFIYSDAQFNLDDWIGALKPWLIHTHLNNNDGHIDEHHGLNYARGVLKYGEILPKLRALPTPPAMILEMDSVDDMRASLPFFELSEVKK